MLSCYTAASLTVPFSSCMVFLALSSLLHHYQASKQHTSINLASFSLVIFRCRTILLPLRLPFFRSLPLPSGILSRCLFIHIAIFSHCYRSITNTITSDMLPCCHCSSLPLYIFFLGIYDVTSNNFSTYYSSCFSLFIFHCNSTPRRVCALQIH